MYSLKVSSLCDFLSKLPFEIHLSTAFCPVNRRETHSRFCSYNIKELIPKVQRSTSSKLACPSVESDLSHVTSFEPEAKHDNGDEDDDADTDLGEEDYASLRELPEAHLQELMAYEVRARLLYMFTYELPS